VPGKPAPCFPAKHRRRRLSAFTLHPVQGNPWRSPTRAGARDRHAPACAIAPTSRSGASGQVRLHHGSRRDLRRLLILRDAQDVLVGALSKPHEQRHPAASHESAAPPTCGSSLSIAPRTRGPRASTGRATMSLSNNDHACPVCGRPMRLLTTIRRVPGEQTLVLQCGPCGLSTTETLLGWQGNLRCRRHPILVAPPPPTLSTHRVRHAGPFERTSATAIDVEGVQYCTDLAQATAKPKGQVRFRVSPHLDLHGVRASELGDYRRASLYMTEGTLLMSTPKPVTSGTSISVLIIIAGPVLSG
jgi:hypothetical protein